MKTHMKKIVIENKLQCANALLGLQFVALSPALLSSTGTPHAEEQKQYGEMKDSKRLEIVLVYLHAQA